jgi:hypothetical protein
MQFCDVFISHLSPFQFGVVVKKGCEVVVHGIRINFDGHTNWVVLQINLTNAFNTISHKVIFQKFRAIGS